MDLPLSWFKELEGPKKPRLREIPSDKSTNFSIVQWKNGGWKRLFSCNISARSQPGQAKCYIVENSPLIGVFSRFGVKRMEHILASAGKNGSRLPRRVARLVNRARSANDSASNSSDSRPLRGKHLINHPHDPLGEGDRVQNSTVRCWRGPGAVLLGQLTSSKDCGHNPNYTFAAFVHGGQDTTFVFYSSRPAE